MAKQITMTAPATFSLRLLRKSAYLTRKFLSAGGTTALRAEQRLTALIDGRSTAQSLTSRPSWSAKRIRQFEDVYYSGNPLVTPIMPALPKAGRKPKVTLLIPSLSGSSLFGGVATAVIFSALWSKKLGMELRIVQTVASGDRKNLQSLFDTYRIDFDVDVIEVLSVAERRFDFYGYLDLHPEDQLVVSAWWDAHLASRLPLCKKFIYLIQDYEPLFSPNGDTKILAEATYRVDNFVGVCNSSLMKDFIETHQIVPASTKVTYFEPAVSMLADRRAESQNKRKKLFFYARPNVDRNLYYFGLQVLNHAFMTGTLNQEDWEVLTAGEAIENDVQLQSGLIVTNLGKLSLVEYERLKLETELALCLMMAPHPSYPPLELALAGAAVVTSRYGNKSDISHMCQNIICCDTDLDEMARALGRAAQLPVDTRKQNAAQSLLPHYWVDAFKPVFEILDSVNL